MVLQSHHRVRAGRPGDRKFPFVSATAWARGTENTPGNPMPLHHKRGPRESGGKRPHRRYVLNGTDTIDLRVRKLFSSRQYSLTYPAKRGSGPEDL